MTSFSTVLAKLAAGLTVSAAALALASASLAATATEGPVLTLTPAPAKAQLGQGTFALTAQTRIFVPKGDVETRVVAGQLSDMLFKARGLKLAVSRASPSSARPPLLSSGDRPPATRPRPTPWPLPPPA
jgi:hexosaminidase